MKVYSNLFAYLNDSDCVTEFSPLHSCDRPIVLLDRDESMSSNSLLISHENRVYEIGYPHLNPSDLHHHDNYLLFELVLVINNIHYSLKITDEILDEETIEDENILEEWLNSPWNNLLDSSVSQLLQIFNGLFKGKQINLYQLPEDLSQFNLVEATLPLIISLERRYELTRKLRDITPKLRTQLRRQAELISIGRIQEMDSYCLRDYTRRSGRTPEEKAGASQQLMGIKRYQDYNTLENKFLVYFAGKVLHLECFRYQKSGAIAYSDSVDKFYKTIEFFKQNPTVKAISSRYFQLNKPNYVLQQNHIYSGFYRAYLDYIYEKYEKERVWSFRNQLLGDTVYLGLMAALLSFQGIHLKPLATLETRPSPDQGNYLLKNDNKYIPIQITLQDYVYEFTLKKNSNLFGGDYQLIKEVHNLKSPNFTTTKQQIPIWIFWYQPSDQVITQAQQYLQNQTKTYPIGILIYLQTPPNQSVAQCKVTPSSEQLWLCQIANPINAEGFSQIVEFLAKEIIIPLAEVV